MVAFAHRCPIMLVPRTRKVFGLRRVFGYLEGNPKEKSRKWVET